MPNQPDVFLNSCSALIAIDNAKIRKQCESDSSRTLKKLVLLEERLKSFTRIDEKLYADWYKQAYGADLRRISEREAELYALRDIQKETIDIAKYRGLPMAAAYRWALEERRLLASPDLEMREEVRRMRRERAQFFHEEYLKEERLWEEEEQKREEEETRRRQRKWEKEQKQREAEEGTKSSFTEQIKDAEGAEYAEHTYDFGDSDSGDDCRGPTHFAEPPQPPIFGPAEEIRLKILYRQLARLIHPDLKSDGNGGKMESWQLNIWADAQQRLKDKDLGGLESCLRLAQLRLKETKELTISEMLEAKERLERELSAMEWNARRLRRRPAWNFSLKKLTPRLVGKLRRELDDKLQELESSLNYFRREHEKYLNESQPQNPGSDSGVHPDAADTQNK